MKFDAFVPPTETEEEDPDLPPFMRSVISKAEYMEKRSQETATLRGIVEGRPYDVRIRTGEIGKMFKQEEARLTDPWTSIAQKRAMVAQWTSIGPAPIPNGQTNNVTTAVSGRVTAIVVHPTNPNIVYVGTAQGGLYRTTDGGSNWTAIMDSAASLAIGAIAMNPQNSDQLFVGTGESNRSSYSYAGVGLYRIDNASSATPTISGPFSTRVAGTGTGASTGLAFNNTAVSAIVVDPNDQNRIYVGNTSAIYGLGGTFPSSSVTAFVGLYLSENAQASTVTFSRVVNLPGDGNSSVTDLAFEPGSSNRLIVATRDLNAAVDDSGIYLSTDAASGSVSGNVSPTFTRTLNLSASQAHGSVVAVNKVGSTVTVVAAANGSSSGAAYKSVDGGATWSQLTAANGFCGVQCFFDTEIAIDANDANYIYLLGSSSGASSRIFARSSDGGATFAANENGLHADSHAIGIAPSNSSIVYTGNDGGIYKTGDVKAATISWTSLNNSQFLATQFMSIDTHPSDSNFTIGGTQDNGTNWYKPDGTWFRADYGDGGYAVIDQNAADTVNVTMYHTYFNQTNAMGYGKVTSTASATDGNWAFYGCGFGGNANGMTCTATAIRFYAPMERGPGNPNTLYFGSDVLYRSSNAGVTMTKVSQDPIVSGVAITAIGIGPSNDSVRMVGLANGGIYGTTSGSSTLTDLDPGTAVPTAFVTRVAVDPSNSNVVYVTLNQYGSGVQNVWKTTNVNAFADGFVPTWTAASTGLPTVPVNAFVIDPFNSSNLYAGTDIGVYTSSDGGGTWSPLGSNLPKVAVFDMSFAGSGVNRLLRIATHGKGMYDFPLPFIPTAAGVTVEGAVRDFNGRGLLNVRVTMVDSKGLVQVTRTNAFGKFKLEGVPAGEQYVLNLSVKNYKFAPRAITVDDSMEGIDFMPVH